MHQREREFHVARLSDVDVVKGLITLRAQLDIYNDFMQDSGGKLGVSNWKNVNQEVVVLYADLDVLIEKSGLSESQTALLKLVGSGLEVSDVAYMLGVDEKLVSKSINAACRRIVRHNNRDWSLWAHFTYIKSEWKKCRGCGEIYPRLESFFRTNSNAKDGHRNVCILCENKHFGGKSAENAVPNPVGEEINNFDSKPKDKVKVKKKKKKSRAKNNNKPNGMKLILPDGTKTILPNTKDMERRKLVVDDILNTHKKYFELNWDSDRIKICLDVLGYYLCKPVTDEHVDDGILSGYKMNEMKEGSKKHLTFSSMSRRQRATLGLLDFDDEE